MNNLSNQFLVKNIFLSGNFISANIEAKATYLQTNTSVIQEKNSSAKITFTSIISGGLLSANREK